MNCALEYVMSAHYKTECDDSSEIICDIAYDNPNMDQCFVCRGKVTDIKIDKEE